MLPVLYLQSLPLVRQPALKVQQSLQKPVAADPGLQSHVGRRLMRVLHEPDRFQIKSSAASFALQVPTPLVPLWILLRCLLSLG